MNLASMFHSMHSSTVPQKQFSLLLKKQYIFTQLPMGYFNSPVSAHTFTGKILSTSNSFQEHRCYIILITSSCKEIQTIYTLTRDYKHLSQNFPIRVGPLHPVKFTSVKFQDITHQPKDDLYLMQ